jgi:hypothetical protein
MRAVLKLIAEIETTTQWRLVRNPAVGWIFRSLPDILPSVPPEDEDRPLRVVGLPISKPPF